MELIITWINGAGHETDDTAGYNAADYFGHGDYDEAMALVAEGNVAEADALLHRSYKGADIDGIGLRWEVI